jgi:hypothetical protein
MTMGLIKQTVVGKDVYYFSHDSNARNDNKMIAVRMKYGASGYGIYFMLIEKLRESADYKCVKDYNIIAFDLRVDASIVKSIVEDFGLFAFTENGECFYSESLLRRMNPLDNLRKKRSEAGKAGMKNRWESEQLKQTDNNVITQLPKSDNNKSKVNKEEEQESIKEKAKRFFPPTCEEVVGYCTERKNSVDADKFFNFYQSKGWMVGKNRMKDWRAAVRTWELEDAKRSANRPGSLDKQQSDFANRLNQKLKSNGSKKQ